MAELQHGSGATSAAVCCSSTLPDRPNEARQARPLGRLSTAVECGLVIGYSLIKGLQLTPGRQRVPLVRRRKPKALYLF